MEPRSSAEELPTDGKTANSAPTDGLVSYSSKFFTSRHHQLRLGANASLSFSL